MRNVRTSLMFAAVAVMFAIAISPANGQGKGQGKGKGGFQGGGMGMFGGAPTGLMLLMNKGVQEELKLTKDQTDKIEKAQTAAMEKMREAFSGGFDAEKAAELRKQMTEDGNKLAKEIVTPEQAKRLKQIELQVGAQMGGLTTFTTEDVQKELKLTDAQKSSLKELNDEVTKERAALMQSIRGGGGDRQEAMQKIQSMSKKAMTQFTDSLTADQKKTWEAMTGPKFEYKADAPRTPRRDL